MFSTCDLGPSLIALLFNSSSGLICLPGLRLLRRYLRTAYTSPHSDDPTVTARKTGGNSKVITCLPPQEPWEGVWFLHPKAFCSLCWTLFRDCLFRDCLRYCALSNALRALLWLCFASILWRWLSEKRTQIPGSILDQDRKLPLYARQCRESRKNILA